MADEVVNNSLVKKHLNADLWKALSNRTSFGTTIYDCIVSAIDNPKSKVGLYALDAEAYNVFPEIFEPVIAEYHGVDIATLKSVHKLMPDEVDGKVPELPPLEDSKFEDAILSTRVRVGRTVKGFPMAGKLSPEKRVELEQKIVASLKAFNDHEELKGTYTSLNAMSEERKTELVQKHLLFNDGEDNCLRSAGGYNDWPNGRGIFMNDAETFIIWVNEEDHIRIISMEQGASLKSVWERLVKAINIMQEQLEFVCDEKYGYLTFCPTNIGTGLRASVHIKLPNLGQNKPALDKMCNDINLQARGCDGEHKETTDNIYDISNKVRIGCTEWDLINTMWTGIQTILKNETSA